MMKASDVTMTRIAVQPEHGPFPVGPYSTAIRAGDFLFLAGQTARDRQRNVVGKGDIVAQTRQTWENVKAIVEAAGGTMDDIVSTVKYVIGVEGYLGSPARSIGETYFTNALPADTLVEVRRLASPDLLIEIQAVAFIPARR